MAVNIYGMSGCTTVRRALAWLDDNGVVYAYHRYEKLDDLADVLNGLIDASDLSHVLNQASQAFKKLDADVQAQLLGNRAKAVQAMVQNPRLAKRPIAHDGHRVLSGFKADQWQAAFNDNALGNRPSSDPVRRTV